MNLSQQRREESIRKIREIREFIKHSAQDENAGRLLTYLSELEKDVKGKFPLYMYIVRRQQKYFASLNEEYGLSCMMKVTVSM